MNKRLAEVEHLMPILCDLCENPDDVRHEDAVKIHDAYLWLLQQAERVAELEDILIKLQNTMGHAEIFIRTRSKMRPVGQKIYRGDLQKIEELLEKTP